MLQNCGFGMTMTPEDLFKENVGEFNIFTATQDIFSTQTEEPKFVQSVVSNYTQASSYFSPPKNRTQNSQFFQFSQPFQNFKVSQNFNSQHEKFFQSQVEEELNFLHQNSQTILNEDDERDQSFSEDFFESQQLENFEFTQPAPVNDENQTPSIIDRNIFESQLDLFGSCKSVKSSIISTINNVNELIDLDDIPIPQSIINMYTMIRKNYSDWVFVYAMTAQLCSDYFPTGTYFNLKQSLLLSIASLNGSVPPLQIIALGRNTSDANIAMNSIGSLAER